MNQAPIEEKLNAYTIKIKTVQFIYIIEKVGLMNQAPTRKTIGNGNNEENRRKWGLAPFFMNQAPTRKT
jgi:hypothetical protein